MTITLDGTAGITTPDITSGPVAGTTGTFSGAVQTSGISTNLYPLVLGTPVASTSGTAIDFTSIPSWAKRITVMFRGVSTNGSTALLVQLGSTTFTTTGYLSTSSYLGATTGVTSSTAGMVMFSNSGTALFSGQMVLTNISGDEWVSSHTAKYTSAFIIAGGGDVTLSGVLDRVRITAVNGTDAFDAGLINIMWE